MPTVMYSTATDNHSTYRDYSENIAKLQRISLLGDNWDGYGAEHIPEHLILSASRLLRKLYFQPEIFPTSAGSLQLEYEKDKGDYLEFQFYGNGSCEVFRCIDGSEEYFHSLDNHNAINTLVEDFYGRYLHRVCIKGFSYDNSR